MLFPNGAKVAVGGLAIRLVRIFMERPHTIIRRDVLMDRIWPGEPHDRRRKHSLDQAISQLNLVSRDVGMLSLITHAHGIGHSWTPTEEDD
jgi:DNA-binding winged helix-turn-helix (wHTH) protein